MLLSPCTSAERKKKKKKIKHTEKMENDARRPSTYASQELNKNKKRGENHFLWKTK